MNALNLSVSAGPPTYPLSRMEVARYGIPATTYQTEFDDVVSSGYQPVWVDGYEVGGETFFNALFRPVDGTAWVARHGLTAAAYQQELSTRIRQGFRLMQVESYCSAGVVGYAAIFAHPAAPACVAYHGYSPEAHQKRFDELVTDGWRPVNVTGVSLSGALQFTALYERRDVGSFAAWSCLRLGDYQFALDDNRKAGRQLVYLNAYTHKGDPRISAIWHEKAAAPFVARHGLSTRQYQAERDRQLADGYLTRAVTGYEEDGSHRFAALWSK